MYTLRLRARSLALTRGLLVTLVLALGLVMLWAAWPLSRPAAASAPAVIPNSDNPPLSLAHHLRGSYKIASQYVVASGEMLTYTIRLHNCGPIMATATVTDPLPAEMNYVPGSATEGGVYDPDTRTLSWSNVLVSAMSGQSLSFVATATTVASPTFVVNRATIAADSDSFERWTAVLLVPEPTSQDIIPPVVHGLTIDEQDVLTEPTVTLHISATDNVSVTRMYLREWQWVTAPGPHWRTVKSSGWVPYQADYPWTLGTESGTHYVGVWVADGAFHLSHLDRRALDFASLLVPGETVPERRVIPYQVYYEQDVEVTAVLTPTAGDADLYVWYPGGSWPGPYSIQPGTLTDTVHFTTTWRSTYLFLVYGYEAATYDFSITPGGGPRAWGVTGAYSRGAGQATAREALFDKPSIQDLVTSLLASGLDPLGSPAAFGPFEVYLPTVVR